MAEYRIGVVGIPGKWSTETLADAVEKKTGQRLVIDMADVSLDLEKQRLVFQDMDLCRLDALIIKKISASYSPATLDRLELLRVAEQAGVRVFSRAENMLRLIDRLSCTVTLRNAGNPCHRGCRRGAGGRAGFWQCRVQAAIFHQGTRHVRDRFRQRPGQGRA